MSKIYNSCCLTNIYNGANLVAQYGVNNVSDIAALYDAEMKGGAASIPYYTSFTVDDKYQHTFTKSSTNATSVINARNIGRVATGTGCYGWQADSATPANNGYPVFYTSPTSSITLKDRLMPIPV